MFLLGMSGGSHLSPDTGTLKYGQPGGDTLSDFVTLVCQEASNSQQQVCTAITRY